MTERSSWTDEQAGRYNWDEVSGTIRQPVYVFNVAGYKVGTTPNQDNWYTFGGLTDACFELIPLLERRRRAGLWPWETAAA